METSNNDPAQGLHTLKSGPGLQCHDSVLRETGVIYTTELYVLRFIEYLVYRLRCTSERCHEQIEYLTLLCR